MLCHLNLIFSYRFYIDLLGGLYTVNLLYKNLLNVQLLLQSSFQFLIKIDFLLRRIYYPAHTIFTKNFPKIS